MRKTTSRPVFVAKAAGVMLAAGALGLAVAGSASAAANVTVTTSDSGPSGGKVTYSPDSATLTVCDTQADGLRVYGSMTWFHDNTYDGYDYSDANGNGTCVKGYTSDLYPGTKFTVSACLRDGATGTLRYCRSATGTA